jgi:3-phenylpropionate/trans-cinnamate dioxygenase ferredoxin reductase subunit
MKHTQTYQVTLGDDVFKVQAGQTILDAALIVNIDFPHNCQVGACASCQCQLLKGDIRALTDFAYVLDDQALDAGMILACQSTPKSDLSLTLPES